MTPLEEAERAMGLKEKIRRQHKHHSNFPFRNYPHDAFPEWMFWKELNRCPRCLELSYYAERGGDGEHYCPNCFRELPSRWFTTVIR